MTSDKVGSDTEHLFHQPSECFRPALTLTRLDDESSASTNDFEAFRMTTPDRMDVEAIVAQSDDYQTKSEFYRVAVRTLLRAEAERELAEIGGVAGYTEVQES